MSKMSGSYYRRLSINVALDVGDAIDSLAATHNTTITDIVRRAVSIYKFCDDEQRMGSAVLVRQRDGTISEINWPDWSGPERN